MGYTMTNHKRDEAGIKLATLSYAGVSSCGTLTIRPQQLEITLQHIVYILFSKRTRSYCINALASV
jgi:hypothetical protein